MTPSGTMVVRYSYDAWGNILSITGSLANSLGKDNPFRYRSYYYDNETGWYYLKSRYYDPSICRFISPDDRMLTGEGADGLNLYAYCKNNPVNLSDPDGHWPQWLKNAVKWGTENIAMPVTDFAQNTLSKLSRTFSIGLSGGGTMGIAGATGTVCVSVDTEGSIEFQAAYSWGITSTPGFGISGGYYSMTTNAPTVDNLLGESGVIGGTVFVPVYGIPVGGGVDLNILPDPDSPKTYFGLSLIKGFSTSPGMEFHSGPGESTIIPKTKKINIFQKANELY